MIGVQVNDKKNIIYHRHFHKNTSICLKEILIPKRCFHAEVKLSPKNLASYQSNLLIAVIRSFKRIYAKDLTRNWNVFGYA